MDMRRCSCGKYYDASQANSCPYCNGAYKDVFDGQFSIRSTYVKLMFGNKAKIYNLIPGKDYLVGRSTHECYIQVPEDFTDVSRVHCAIDAVQTRGNGQKIRIQDLSQNGIIMYDRKAKKDKFCMVNGTMELVLESPEDKLLFLLGGQTVAIEVGIAS